MGGPRAAVGGALTGAAFGATVPGMAMSIVRQQLSGLVSRMTHLPVGEVAAKRVALGSPAVRDELEKHPMVSRTVLGVKSTPHYERRMDWVLDQFGLLSDEKRRKARTPVSYRSTPSRGSGRPKLPSAPSLPQLPRYAQ